MRVMVDRNTLPLLAARELLDVATRVYRKDGEVVAQIDAYRRRLDEPLRVALVGSVKAGKSTLLNALLGQHVAPTDARECTKVVTWYRHGATPTVQAVGVDGEVTRLPVVRQQDRLELDLGELEPERLERLDVAWPVEVLADLVLIDTPGTASISASVSERTEDFLVPRDGVSGVDAVVYMLRSLHCSDVEFLHHLRDHNGHGRSALGSIAVLSRADEVGGGRLDAMVSVNRAVRAMRADPALDGLVEAIVPVAGLLALAGSTLRQSEFTALVALEKIPRQRLQSLLMSADRFIAEEDDELPAVPIRSRLVQRFGIYGIRLAVATLRGGISDAPTLSEELVRRSGIGELREILDSNFRQGNEELKAHTAVLGLQRLLTEHPRPGSQELLETSQDYLANSHAFREMRLVSRIRSESLMVPDPASSEQLRLIGGSGSSMAERLGLAEGASPEELCDAAHAALQRWLDIADNPLTPAGTVDACRVVIRSCEGIINQVSARVPASRC